MPSSEKIKLLKCSALNKGQNVVSAIDETARMTELLLLFVGEGRARPTVTELLVKDALVPGMKLQGSYEAAMYDRIRKKLARLWIKLQEFAKTKSSEARPEVADSKVSPCNSLEDEADDNTRFVQFEDCVMKDNDIHALQEEIQKLRAENKKGKEENKRLQEVISRMKHPMEAGKHPKRKCSEDVDDNGDSRHPRLKQAEDPISEKDNDGGSEDAEDDGDFQNDFSDNFDAINDRPPESDSDGMNENSIRTVPCLNALPACILRFQKLQEVEAQHRAEDSRGDKEGLGEEATRNAGNSSEIVSAAAAGVRAMPLPRVRTSAEETTLAAVAAVTSFDAANSDSIAEEVLVEAPVTAAAGGADTEAGGNDVGVLECQLATLKRKLDRARAVSATSDSSAVAPTTASWVCESDTAGWLPFDAATQARLETEYSAGAPSVRTYRGEWAYSVDFSEMVQTNTTTGVRRSVRRRICVVDGDDTIDGYPRS